MRKTFTLLIALMALTVSSWAMQVTWNQAAVQSINVSCNGENYYVPRSQGGNGISVTANTPNSGSNSDYSYFYYDTYEDANVSRISVNGGGTLTFSSVGNITSIVIHTDENGYGSASGWTWSNEQHTLSWTGNAASVVLTDASVNNITSIVFEVSVPSSYSLNQAAVQSINVSCNGENYYEPQSQGVNGISVTANTPNSGSNSDYSYFYYDTYEDANVSRISVNGGGTLTFSSVTNITSIVIHTDENGYGSASGWTWSNEQHTLTWTGDAASVVLADNAYVSNITSIDFIFASNDPEPTPEPAVTTSTITWDQTDVASLSLADNDVDEFSASNEINDITASLTRTNAGQYTYCQISNRNFWITNGCGSLTFSHSTGKISNIVITYDDNYSYHSLSDLSAGWTEVTQAHTLTWTGTASDEVTLSGGMDIMVSSIEFTVVTEAASADPTPANQDPVTWDFTNDAELASIYLRQYTQYNFGGYYQENYDNHYEDSVKNFKGIVATISAMTDGSYACFSNQNNYSIDLENGGTLTFSTELGQFQSIVINTTSNGSSSGDWTWVSKEHTLTWAGTPANSVVLNNIDISDITSIVFTFVSSASATPEPTETATIHFAEIYHSEITEFTHTDDDCGHRNGFLTPLFNVWLENENGQDITDVMPLTVTSSDEKVVTVSLGDYYDDPNDPDRLITCQPTGYGTATITATFAGDETYYPTQASFTYNFYRNETSMAECALVDKNGDPVTSIVATEGDLIDAPYLARVDGEDLCYTYLAMATTTNRSRWRLNPETNRWDYFYPKKAGLDTIVFTYYRESSFDSRETEDYKYWDQGVEVRIPVQINPLITPIGASAQMNMNPAVNANMAFSNTENDFYNLEEDQLEIQSVVDPVALQLAIDSMAAGTKDWNDLLPGATTFNVEPGNGKLNIQCETTAGYELKVLIRGHGTVSVSQPSMGIAEVDYDVDEVTTVLIYLAATSGGSSAPRRAPAATKDAAPKAIIKAISVIPMVEVTAKPDPENGDVYYSTFYDSEKKYQLPAGTEAYVAELNTNELLMTKIAENGQVIPAGNAVILKSEAASVDLIATDDAPVSFSATNDLHGVDEATAAPANCYVLSGHSTDNSVTGVGFYEFTGTIPAHKAYLTISGGAAYAPKKLRFVFNNEQQATGIDNAADGIMSEKRIENGKLVIIKNGVRYNAQGQIVK